MGSDRGARRRGPLWGALEEIRGHLQAGYQAVYDADLKGYFDSIPHSQLRCVCAHAGGGPLGPAVDPDVAGGAYSRAE